MRKFIKFTAVATLIYLLSGCGSKQYFEPENVDGTFRQTFKSLNADIVDFNKSGATLSDGSFITNKGITKNPINSEFFFVNTSDGNIISADAKGNIAINNQIIKLENIIISATLNKNLLAIVYLDNSVAVYDIVQNKTIFKEYLGESLANDTKVTNPIFMSDLILFPSLNGKVIVYSITDAKVIRDIIVDASNKQFKNITFFEVVDEQLIAATANSVLSIGANLHSLNLEIKDIATRDNKIYIATIDGKILVMDNRLKPYNEQKFKFGKIFGMGFGKDAVYAIEQSGYIIKMDRDLKNPSILNISFDNEEKFISIGNKLYFGNQYIELN